MTRFYETDSPGRWFVGIWGWIIASVVIVVVLSLAGWGISVLFASPSGRANAYRQQQSATNRIFAQQHFHEVYQDYIQTTHKIPIYQAQAKNGSYAAQTNLVGLQSHCMDDVSQYNADARKYLTKDFRDADLPSTLDPSPCEVSP